MYDSLVVLHLLEGVGNNPAQYFFAQIPLHSFYNVACLWGGNHELNRVLDVYYGWLSAWSVPQEIIRINFQESADHLASFDRDLSLFGNVQESTPNIFLRGLDLEGLYPLVLEWQAEWFEHHFRHLDPRIVHFHQIRFFLYLTVFYPELLLVTFDGLGHELENLASISPGAGRLLIRREHGLDSGLPLFLPLLLFELSPKHLYYVRVLLLLPLGLLLIQLLLEDGLLIPTVL